MVDRGGFAEQPTRPSYRVADQSRIDAARAASGVRERAGAWYRANQDMNAAAARSQGWESRIPDNKRLVPASASAKAEVGRAQYVTAADLEANPYTAMQAAADLAANNPLDTRPTVDEYGVRTRKTESARPPMPEVPVLLDKNPRTALQQVMAMLNVTRGALSQYLTRLRPTRVTESIPATARVEVPDVPATRETFGAYARPDVIGDYLRESLDQPATPLAGGTALPVMNRSRWNEGRQPIQGELPQVPAESNSTTPPAADADPALGAILGQLNDLSQPEAPATNTGAVAAPAAEAAA